MFAIRWIIAKAAQYWDALSAILTYAIPVIGGLVSGWAAWTADIFPRYAPFSWVAAGLLGALISAIIVAAVMAIRMLAVRAAALSRWNVEPDAVNPLDTEFTKKRLRITDIAKPWNHMIEGKKFINCELTGPCNILFYQNANMFNSSIVNCDVVVVRAHATSVTVFPLKDVTIIGCVLHNMTIFVHPDHVNKFKEMGAPFLTLTGDPEIDSAKPIEPKRRPP